MRCHIQLQLTVTCLLLFLLIHIKLIASQDDFGSGDYSDTGGTDPVVPGSVPGTGGSGTGGGSGGDGNGGGSNDGGIGGDDFPGLEPDPIPVPPPRGGSGGGGGSNGGGNGGVGGQVPRARPPNNTPATYPRPAYPRPAYPSQPAYPRSRPRYDPRPWQRANQTDRPWVQDGIEEDTLWNRLINFISNLTNDVGRVQGNEYIDFVGYQLNRFIDVFRYQGYDADDHFHHCTQRVGGCPYYPDRRPPTDPSPPTTPTESPEEPGGGEEGGEGETENLSARRRPAGNRTRAVTRNQTSAAVLTVPVTSRNQTRRKRTRKSKTVFRTIKVN